LNDPIQQRVRTAVAAALDKKAFDLDVLGVSELTSIADYFVLCSANTERQTQAIADGVAKPGPGDPDVVVCLDEFGPLNLQPQPGGKAWAPRAKPRRIRATYTRPHGVRHLLCALDVGSDLLTGEVSERKTRVEFLAFCERIRLLYPAETRLAFVLDNFSVHKGDEMRTWAARNNVELAYTPHYSSWLNSENPIGCLAGV